MEEESLSATPLRLACGHDIKTWHDCSCLLVSSCMCSQGAWPQGVRQKESVQVH